MGVSVCVTANAVTCPAILVTHAHVKLCKGINFPSLSYFITSILHDLIN